MYFFFFLCNYSGKKPLLCCNAPGSVLYFIQITLRKEIVMSSNYLDIQAPPGSEKLIRQDLKFKTGKFVWRIKFTAPLNPATVNANNLYVTTSKGDLLGAYISYNEDSNSIEISPASAYSTTELYTLHITTKVQSRGGQSLKQPMQINFKFK